MLSDKEIEKAIEDRQENSTKGISIELFEKKYLTPVGYDLRVGEEGFSWNKKCITNISKEGRIEIEPKDTVVIKTLESVSLSNRFSATIHSIVSKIITKGLSDISTTIDPGWSGKLLITLHNYRVNTTELRFKERLCTVCFYKLDKAAQGNLDRPSDRDDLWEQLLDIARQEEEKIELHRKLEQEKINNNNQKRTTFLWIWIIGVIFIIILISRYNSSLGSSIAGILAAISPLIYERFLKPIPKP